MKKIISTLFFGLIFMSVAFAGTCPDSCDGKCGVGECKACCDEEATKAETETDCKNITDTTLDKGSSSSGGSSSDTRQGQSN